MSAFEITMVTLTAISLLIKLVKNVIEWLDSRYKRK